MGPNDDSQITIPASSQDLQNDRKNGHRQDRADEFPVENLQKLARRVSSPPWLDQLRRLDREEMCRRLRDSIPRLDQQLTGLAQSRLFQVREPNRSTDRFNLVNADRQYRQFAIAIGLMDSLTANLPELFQTRLRTRSLAVAVLAHQWSVAKPGSHSETSSPFGLAILRSIGMAVMLHEFGATYRQFIEAAYLECADQRHLESITLGFDNIELAETLLRSWKLDELFADQEQHRNAIAFAEHMVCVLLNRQNDPFGMAAVHLGQLGLAPEQMSRWISGAEEAMQDIASRIFWNFSLRIPLRQSLVTLLTQQTALKSLRNDVEQQLTQAPSCQLSSLPSGATQTEHGTTTADKDKPSVSTCSALQTLVGDAIPVCRRNRSSLHLTLLEFDNLELFRHNRSLDLDYSTAQLARIISDISDSESTTRLLEPGRLAVLSYGGDRPDVVAMGRQLLIASDHWARNRSAIGLTISLGIASMGIPPRNFRAINLIVAAQRCLKAAQDAGGGTLKSIDVL